MNRTFEHRRPRAMPKPRSVAPLTAAHADTPRPDVRRQPAMPAERPDQATSLRDPGIALLTTVTGAMLGVVALAWLVGAVDRWWILIPVIAAALALTAIVLTMVTRLLNDADQ